MSNPFANWSAADVAAYNARQQSSGDESDPYVLDAPVRYESDLHDEISKLCKQRGWIAFHGSMAHKALRTLGEPDYTILADRGRVFFIECKTKTGKLSTEQLALQMMAGQLGHTIHTVRSLEEFRKIIA